MLWTRRHPKFLQRTWRATASPAGSRTDDIKGCKWFSDRKTLITQGKCPLPCSLSGMSSEFNPTLRSSEGIGGLGDGQLTPTGLHQAPAIHTHPRFYSQNVRSGGGAAKERKRDKRRCERPSFLRRKGERNEEWKRRRMKRRRLFHTPTLFSRTRAKRYTEADLWPFFSECNKMTALTTGWCKSIQPFWHGWLRKYWIIWTITIICSID